MFWNAPVASRARTVGGSSSVRIPRLAELTRVAVIKAIAREVIVLPELLDVVWDVGVV